MTNLPSAMTLRCAAFKRKGAKILTVLLVVVLFVVNICFTSGRPASTGRSSFFTGPLTPVSPRCGAESKTGAVQGKSQVQRPFDLRRYSIVLLVQSASCVGIEWFIAVCTRMRADTTQRFRVCRQFARSMLMKLHTVSLHNFVSWLPFCRNLSLPVRL